MNIEITQPTFVRSYWNYFIELEEKVISTKRFVAFDKSNYSTFSIEYLKLLQAACSEIDVVAKIIAEQFDSEFKSQKNKNIYKWGFAIQNIFPNIDTIKVHFNNEDDFIPWKKWKYEKYKDAQNRTNCRLVKGYENPDWWKAYNKVKHERTAPFKDSRSKTTKTNYARANLKNLLSAMAALYILENLFLSRLDESDNKIPYQKSKLFTLLPDKNK